MKSTSRYLLFFLTPLAMPVTLESQAVATYEARAVATAHASSIVIPASMVNET